MVKNPELERFERRTAKLGRHPVLRAHVVGDAVDLEALTLDDVEELAREEVGYYFLIAAAGLNRTALKRSMKSAAAQIVERRLRRAFAIKERLPLEASLSATAQKSIALREVDLKRKRRGAVEALLRERLKAEGIPILMSPPVRRVPALLITQRKPDGVYPDPSTGRAPQVLLEIKSVRRVSDDIQKRLYEIAESSLEMKIIYGALRLDGLGITTTKEVAGNKELRRRVREQVVASAPTVVAFFICEAQEAERYREGAETFIDRVFFQEEVEECIAFLRESVASVEGDKAVN